MYCAALADGEGEFEPLFISLIFKNSFELARLLFYWAEPAFFVRASIETLQVWIAYLRILGFGLTRGDAFTRMRDGGDWRWTTFGA